MLEMGLSGVCYLVLLKFCARQRRREVLLILNRRTVPFLYRSVSRDYSTTVGLASDTGVRDCYCYSNRAY